jgi:hypothetical protein
VIDLDEPANEAVVVIHWMGGRHTEVRIARVPTGRYLAERQPNPVEVIRTLGDRLPDRELAVTMNRMRCKGPGGRVMDYRERAVLYPLYTSMQRPSRNRGRRAVVGASITACGYRS